MNGEFVDKSGAVIAIPLVDGLAVNGLKEKKPRVPLRKLTHEMLLDRNTGLPHIYAQVPRMKFKGKGFETEDLNKLLVFYRLWAQDIMPRLQFRDFAQQTEKLCSQRRMRVFLDGMRSGATMNKQAEELSGLTVAQDEEDATHRTSVDNITEDVSGRVVDVQYQDDDDNLWAEELDAELAAMKEAEEASRETVPTANVQVAQSATSNEPDKFDTLNEFLSNEPAETNARPPKRIFDDYDEEDETMDI